MARGSPQHFDVAPTAAWAGHRALTCRPCLLHVTAVTVVSVGHRPDAEVLPQPGQHSCVARLCTLLLVRLPEGAAQLLWGWTLHRLPLLQHLIYKGHQGLGEAATAPLLEGYISRALLVLVVLLLLLLPQPSARGLRHRLLGRLCLLRPLAEGVCGQVWRRRRRLCLQHVCVPLAPSLRGLHIRHLHIRLRGPTQGGLWLLPLALLLPLPLLLLLLLPLLLPLLLLQRLLLLL